MRKRSKIFSLIIMISMLISSVSTVYAQVSDVEKHWAKEEITYMLDKGFLTGYPDGTFRPEDNISKAEFYRIINNLMGYEEKSEFGFKDVKSEDWFYNDVAKGIKAGYLVDAEFLYPKDFITREEVARIIGITFKLSENEELAAYFKDYALMSSSAAGFIGTLKDEGYIAGFPDGNFGPLNNIKRSEVVKMLYNVLMAEGLPQKADLTAYKAALAAVKQSDYTKESWTAYQKVVSANIVTEENSQDEVKAATTAIIAAQSKLVKATVSGGSVSSNPTTPIEKVDKTALMAAIIQAQAKVESNYTPDSWKVLAQALQVAETANSNSNATKEQVNISLVNLTTAINGLVEKEKPVEPEVNKTGLIVAITQAQTKNEADYTENSWIPFAQALASAIQVRDNKETTQKEVDEVLLNLTDAMNGLIEKEEPVEPAITNIMPNKDITLSAGEILTVSFNAPEGGTAYFRIQLSDQTPMKNIDGISMDSNDNYKKTMEEVSSGLYSASWTVRDGVIGSWEIEVNYESNEGVKLREIAEGILNIVKKPVSPVVTKSALEAVITQAQTKNEADYTEESWTPFAQALASAIQVRDNEDATQEEVDEALLNLTDAISGLVEKEEPIDPKVNKTELIAAITQAQTKKEADYTEESWTPFAQALASAMQVRDNEDATQEEVNEALLNLTTTMTALVEEDKPTPTIIVTFHKAFMPTFGHISVQVQNIERAVKFDVVYHLSDNPDGSENTKQTQIVDISQKAGLIFYDPSQHNTVTVRIYDMNNNLLYTFEDIVPVIGN